jgi:hypothetical protein
MQLSWFFSDLRTKMRNLSGLLIAAQLMLSCASAAKTIDQQIFSLFGGLAGGDEAELRAEIQPVMAPVRHLLS